MASRHACLRRRKRTTQRGQDRRGGAGERGGPSFEPRSAEAEENSPQTAGEGEPSGENAETEPRAAVRWEPTVPRLEPKRKNRELAQFLQRCDPKRRVAWVDAF